MVQDPCVWNSISLGICEGHVLPCWYIFWHNFISRPSRLTQLGLTLMSIKCLIFGTLSVPCWDHVRTTLGLALLSDPLQLWNDQDWEKMYMECLLFETMSWYHARTKFGPVLLHDILVLKKYQDLYILKL